MEFLNEKFNKFCKPKCKKYKKVSKDILLIEDFFEDFQGARDFFLCRDKWKCNPYQLHSKPGYESLFPQWVGRVLMEKYIIDNKINHDIFSYEIICNFFYNTDSCLSNISNSGLIPHIDNIENKNTLEHICLINLNNISISTNFYSFNEKEYCKNKNYHDLWTEYQKELEIELINCYKKEKITRKEVEIFLRSKSNLKFKLIKEIEYFPNQAIIYPANLFHSPNVNSIFTESNPRSLLRITFDKKMASMKGVSYS